jgi:uncharacterized oxidoreductase
MELKNKTIVITGGTSGIGRELVKQLIKDNLLIIIGRSADKLQELKKTFSTITTYHADLSDLKQVESVGRAISKTFNNIDVLINNAAVQYTPNFNSNNFQYDTIEQETALNFIAPCCLIYLLLPSLSHGQGAAAILNINSGLGLSPKTSSAIYCATKAGLNSLSQSLAYQFEGSKISVLQAFLPLVETQMTLGRGSGKLSAERAAKKIIHGLSKGLASMDIGKVKLLRLLLRFLPSIAKKIMKAA